MIMIYEKRNSDTLKTVHHMNTSRIWSIVMMGLHFEHQQVKKSMSFRACPGIYLLLHQQSYSGDTGTPAGMTDISYKWRKTVNYHKSAATGLWALS